MTAWLLGCWEGLEIEIEVILFYFFFILPFNFISTPSFTFSAAGKVEEGLEIKIVVIHPVGLTLTSVHCEN